MSKSNCQSQIKKCPLPCGNTEPRLWSVHTGTHRHLFWMEHSRQRPSTGPLLSATRYISWHYHSVHVRDVPYNRQAQRIVTGKHRALPSDRTLYKALFLWLLAGEVWRKLEQVKAAQGTIQRILSRYRLIAPKLPYLFTLTNVLSSP